MPYVHEGQSATGSLITYLEDFQYPISLIHGFNNPVK